MCVHEILEALLEIYLGSLWFPNFVVGFLTTEFMDQKIIQIFNRLNGT